MPVRSQAAHDGADSIRRLLRDATRNDHESIDREISTLDFTDRASYRLFLAIHHAALSNLAGRWRSQDQADFSGLLHCLVEDLRALGSLISFPGTPERQRADSLRQWGIAYVIRGSRLGGAVLRQRVPTGYPTAYLAYAPAISWPEFLKQLERETRALNRQAHAQIIRGAKQAFETFAAATITFGLRHD
jgi:heme oxygenase